MYRRRFCGFSVYLKWKWDINIRTCWRLSKSPLWNFKLGSLLQHIHPQNRGCCWTLCLMGQWHTTMETADWLHTVRFIGHSSEPEKIPSILHYLNWNEKILNSPHTHAHTHKVPSAVCLAETLYLSFFPFFFFGERERERERPRNLLLCSNIQDCVQSNDE